MKRPSLMNFVESSTRGNVPSTLDTKEEKKKKGSLMKLFIQNLYLDIIARLMIDFNFTLDYGGLFI